MKRIVHCSAVLFSATLLLTIGYLTGCATNGPGVSKKNLRFGESVVLIGEQPAQLAFPPIRALSVNLRSTYREDAPQTIRYEEERDYTVNFERGEIRRTANSRMPDFRTNMLFGIEDFDHSKFPGFGNGKFFVFADYITKGKVEWPTQPSQVQFLSKTHAKLAGGENVKVVAFGDSITAGGDATEPNLIFWKRWTDSLQQKYPRAKIEAINGATGGDTTRQGIERLQEKVLNAKPDLVLIGFGMNDHNIGGFGTPLAAFTNNLATMIDRIRKETGAEIILFSTFPPNPKWHYGSHNMEAYALATEKVARAKGCAFGDIFHNWIAISAKKKPEDLLSNNVNHPNDFGHWMYFEVLRHLGL
ncbi:MAG: Lipolytic protein family [Verrucomicrobiales bacterium]|nr:Lipolytic protein family [Verrucomicrobiales bacterium]